MSADLLRRLRCTLVGSQSHTGRASLLGARKTTHRSALPTGALYQGKPRNWASGRRSFPPIPRRLADSYAGSVFKCSRSPPPCRLIHSVLQCSLGVEYRSPFRPAERPHALPNSTFFDQGSLDFGPQYIVSAHWSLQRLNPASSSVASSRPATATLVWLAMAEVTGLVVGAIGLAGLFSACTECFELYQRGHYFGQDYHRLETKFANQWFRLLTWQQACRLVGTGSYDGRLVPNEHVAERLEATLFQLATLLRDGDLLRRKYGLRDADQLPSTSSGSWAIARRSARSNLGQSLAQFGRKMKLTQRKATIGTKVRWAIEHKEKFETLIQHVREFIDDLERLVPGSGLQERQRQMVQTVFDSTCDIQMLESIEEAGIGQFDLISDAASLRLRCIRGQFGPLGDGASSPRDVSPSRPQRETDLPAAQEDWGLDFIPEMPRIASAGETHFLELHRVRCDITTRIFLEEPKYCTRRETDSQWVLVEEPRSLHLCGKAPITDLELFLAQSTQLDFVVFHEYECMHSTVGDESLDCQPIGQSVRVISTNLFSALQELPAIASEHPALHLNSETRFPYYWFYHTRGTLDTQIPARCESEAPGLGEFLEFLRQSTAPEYARVDDLLSRGGISWKYIPYLFVRMACTVLYLQNIGLPITFTCQRVGGVVVERNSKGIEQYQAYRVEDEPRTSSASLGLRLSVYRVEKRLSDLKVRTTLTLRCEQSSSPEDEIQLSSLGVISLQYAAEIDEDSLVSRGKQLLSCFPHRLVSYAGPIVDYVDDLVGLSLQHYMLNPA